MKVSLPGGALTVTEHVVLPPEVVQPPELGVTLAVTDGAAPFTAIVSDCVFGETNLGESCAEAVRCGIEMLKMALEDRCGELPPGMGEPPPPPPHAARARIVTATSARF